MADDFPTELSEDQATKNALFLDTDKMLAELESMTDLGEDSTPSPEDLAPAGEVSEEAVGGEEPAAAPATTAALTPPGFIEFEGRQWPVEEVRALLALNQRMKEDPGVAERVGGALQAPAKSEELPDWLDPEDRQAVGLYREAQEAKGRAQAAETRLARQSEDERRAHVVDSFRSAVSDFKAKHPNLSDAQIAQIADLTGRANIIEGLERTEGSLSAAFDRGMEMTMWSTPELRSLALADQSDTVPANDNKARQRKQSALSPSGTSGGRSSERAVPKTRDELMDAMLADVRQSMAE